MIDKITLTLNSPITEEQWDMIEDVDFKYTDRIVFYTKHGKEVEFVKWKKGKWMSHYDYCKKHKLLPSGLVAFWWCDQCEQGVEHPTNFCPNCGSYNGGKKE